MKITGGIHRFTTCYPEFEHIPMSGFLLVGSEGVALVDATIPTAVERDVVPYLARLGLAPTDIDWVVVTHGHPDHMGGLSQLAMANPDIRVAASEADRRWVEDQSLMWHELFERFPDTLQFGDEVREYIVHDLGGGGQHVTDVLTPGHVIDLGDLRIRAIDAKGHSAGHLAYFEETQRYLFTGDSVQGSGIQHVETETSLPPLYESYKEYTSSLDRMLALDPAAVFSAHHPAAFGDAAAGFLTGSKAFADRSHRLVAEILGEGGARRVAEVASLLHERVEHLDATTYAGPLQMLAGAATHLATLAEQGRATRQDNDMWSAR